MRTLDGSDASLPFSSPFFSTCCMGTLCDAEEEPPQSAAQEKERDAQKSVRDTRHVDYFLRMRWHNDRLVRLITNTLSSRHGTRHNWLPLSRPNLKADTNSGHVSLLLVPVQHLSCKGRCVLQGLPQRGLGGFHDVLVHARTIHRRSPDLKIRHSHTEGASLLEQLT